MNSDQKRNLQVIIVACILNFAFAAEKLFIIIGHQLSDYVWFSIYGGIGVALAALAIHDFFMDIKEGVSTKPDIIV